MTDTNTVIHIIQVVTGKGQQNDHIQLQPLKPKSTSRAVLKKCSNFDVTTFATVQICYYIKNTKHWCTIDGLCSIFAIFTILDTFTKLLQYYYNTLFHPIIPLIHPPSEFHTVEQCLVRSFGLPVKHDRRVVHSLNIGWACVSANDTMIYYLAVAFQVQYVKRMNQGFLDTFPTTV